MDDSRHMQAAGDTEAGFLDVAANALAVMILATMMLLIVSAPIRLAGDVKPEGATPELTFPVHADPVQRPLYDYFLISDAGIATIDLDGIARAAAEAGGDVAIDQGRLSMTVARQSRRDWNDYRANFSPDYAVLKRGSIKLDAVTTDRLFADIAERFEADRITPTFFVLPDAVDAVSPLYWGLRSKGIPVRWYPSSYGESILFERSTRVFELPGALN